MRHRAQTLAERVNLPPPFRLVALGRGDAFGRALEMARDGAGTLVLAERRGRLDFALVLEPEQPLAGARRVHYAAMLAFAEAAAAVAPGRSVGLDWPATLLVDGAAAGEGRLAWPQGAAEEAVPDWLVFGARLVLGRLRAAPGLPVGPRAAEVFARRFLAALNRWDDGGFAALAGAYGERLAPRPGLACAIDDTGDLLLRRGAAAERRPLRPALAAPDGGD